MDLPLPSDLMAQALSASFEDLSLKKQLPLRKKKEKPLLRYSNSEPIYLYHDQENAQSSTVHAQSSPNSPAKFQTNTLNSNLSNSNNTAAVDPSKICKQTYAVNSNEVYIPSSDPYAQPLSAKDMLTVGVDCTASATASSGSMHSTSVRNNALFRSSKPADSPISSRHGSGSSSSTSSHSDTSKGSSVPITSTRVISIQSTSTTQSAKLKFEATLARPPSGRSSRPPSGIGARPPSALRRPLSSTVRNPNYSPSKPYSEVSSSELSNNDEIVLPSEQMNARHFSAGQRNDNNLNSTISKAISTLSRNTCTPSSTTHSKVTEILQTPPRIRSDVCPSNEYQPKTAALYQNSRPNSAKLSRPSTATRAVNSDSESSGSTDRDSYLSDSSSTPYYLKSSRPEVQKCMSEVRPACEGRDSSLSLTETTEGEEDDSDRSISERLPGDGEAEEDYGDEEEDMMDGMEDDDLEGLDDDDESASSTSSPSRASLRARSASLGRLRRLADGDSPAIRMKSARRRTHSSYYDHNTQPALIKSLFANVPPYINFVAEGDKIEQLPWEYRKLLKWRMCSITPNIVKQTIARSGFRPTKKSHDWLGCWGKHMKAQGFKSIREYQKLNHFPGSFQIGRKDRLWRNLSKLQVSFGKKEFNFFPTTYVLPFDMKQLKRAWEDGGNKQKWIVKPPASARGIGIKVINKWTQIPKKRPVIVQKYLSRPLLINESKFDCRVYVYVTSYDPLRIYVFEDGLARFCSTKYSHSMKNINNKYMHLTNYSINKKNNDYESNGDDTMCQGHKWSLKSLWGYLLRKGVNTNEIWKNIKDLIVKTIISSESAINSYVKANVKTRYSVHELFGFDILLDESYKPWVLEVNISPSLHSNSQLDINIKGQMVKDLHNLAGFRLPDKADVVPNPGTDFYRCGPPSNNYCLDKRLSSQTLSSDEKAKHTYYCQRHQDGAALSTIVDTLTPDDLRILIESIDEDSRKGGFQRVFPTPSTHKYLRYFDQARYYNLFLDQWCQKYNRIEAKGIASVESATRLRIHLQSPTEDPRHQWCPPSGRISLSSSQLLSSNQSGFPTVKRKVIPTNELASPGRHSSITSQRSLSVKAS